MTAAVQTHLDPSLFGADRVGVTVSFGRNVENRPLGDLRWAAFQNNVRAAILVAFHNAGEADPYFDVKLGSAKWNGVSEESCTMVVSGSDVNVLFLLQGIRAAARNYDQESIYVSVGGAALISG